MIRRLCLAVTFATLALATQRLVAQGDLILPIKATGQNATFFQTFALREGTTSFPGLATGDLETGGEGIQVVTRLIAQQVPRTVYRWVLVRENGRLRLIRLEETIVETVYVEVQELRLFLLPLAMGQWRSADLGLYSTWSIAYTGPDGTVFATGATVGQQLFGAAFYLGVEGIPDGWYQLSTGEPGGGGGGGGGDPPVEP
jgi:hypothetical protein